MITNYYLTFWIAINLSNTCKGFESSFECANINDSENIKSVGQNIVEFLNEISLFWPLTLKGKKMFHEL